MPYTLIKGEYHIFYPDDPRRGPEPDGDTVKFKPADPALAERLKRSGGVGPHFNNRRMVNLRFEGIDALETHFDHRHQNRQWAEAARNTLLDMAGFGDVRFWDDLPHKVETVEHHPRPGYILSSTIEAHGRLVAFVFAGDSPLVDGASVHLDPAMLEQSLNARLLSQGLVYPAFYSGLPIDLKDRMAQLAFQARSDRMGLWPEATATIDSRATIDNTNDLSELVIWPKLFRRLVRYFAAGHDHLVGFDTWLRADPRHRDDYVLLPNMELGNMHDLIEMTDNQIRMRYRSEDIMILPDGIIPAPRPVPHPVEPGAVRIVAALVNPAGPEAGNETVTVINTGPTTVNLDNWQIVDAQNNRQQLAGALAAGQSRRLVMDDVRLNNRGDTITLIDPQGGHADQVSYTQRDAGRQGWTLLF